MLGSDYTALSQQYLEILTKPECTIGYSVIIKTLKSSSSYTLVVESAVAVVILFC